MAEEAKESVQIGGEWWNQREDGTWLRWNQVTNNWDEAPEGPPQPDPHSVTPAGRTFADVRPLANALIVMLTLCAVMGGIALVSDIAEYSLINRAEEVGITLAEGRSNDSRQIAIGTVQGLLLAVTGIVFIVWFHRCYRNLLAFGVTGLRFKTGWAIGGWFVPIMGLFRPKQIANDIWRASSPSNDRWAWSDPVPGFLLAWWLVWITDTSFNSVASFAFSPAPTIYDLGWQSKFFIVSDFSFSLSAILAIVVVRRLSERQEKRAATIARQATTAPTI